MKLKLHAEKFYHGTNFHVESSFGKHELYFMAFWRNLAGRPRFGKERFSAIPEESSEAELANSDPARPHYGPKDFAWILRALSGVLKSQL